MNLFLLDVDNTLASFRPTAELYKRTCLKLGKKYYLFGLFMIVWLKALWWLPPAVEFQRRLILSLLSRTAPADLERAAAAIAAETAASFRQDFARVLDRYRRPGDRTFILSHCPDPVAQKVAAALGFDGSYALAVRDYLGEGSRPANYDKGAVIREFKRRAPDSRTFYFADDLIDLPGLLAADRGVLVNASGFTKLVCRLCFPRLEIV